jgi:hypothetical protein
MYQAFESVWLINGAAHQTHPQPCKEPHHWPA